MKRGELKNIYNKLGASEKRQWAKEAGYAAFTGLYKYLNSKQNSESYDTVTQALNTTIGQERFNRLNNEVNERNSSVADRLDRSRNLLIRDIYNTNDESKLEQLKKDIILACESQINWIKLGNKI